jgi:2-dehydro-3-deoxyphosphogluconate aldolase/(4S)-4-hydroxy-2-oxoglutarate aldolase
MCCESASGHGGKRVQLTVPVVGILRGVESGFFSELMHAAFAAGLQALEVTMNTELAERIVAGQRPHVPAGKFLGMGTIRNRDEAVRAVDCGAMFLVTPNFDPAVLDYARQTGVPVIAGALTPTEIYRAWVDGAAMVKVFPCGAMGGARYIKDVRGPFEQMKLMPVGGVTLENVSDYFAAGAAAVGVSTALFGREALQGRDVSQLAINVKRFLERCPELQNTL